MLSKQKQKYIVSLHNKKYRKQFGRFLVEGKKGIEEMLEANWPFESLYLTPEAFASFSALPSVFEAEEKIIAQVSTFKSNNFGVAIAKIPEEKYNIPEGNWMIYLDEIKDPGNLGTIIRLADWYGYSTVYCSENCVDTYNPKVVASSMGSIFKVNVENIALKDLVEFSKAPVFLADLNGKSIYDLVFTEKGILVMGSESHGLSPEIKKYANQTISIPKVGKAESLNVAVSTGIILDALARQFH